MTHYTHYLTELLKTRIVELCNGMIFGMVSVNVALLKHACPLQQPPPVTKNTDGTKLRYITRKTYIFPQNDCSGNPRVADGRSAFVRVEIGSHPC